MDGWVAGLGWGCASLHHRQQYHYNFIRLFLTLPLLKLRDGGYAFFHSFIYSSFAVFTIILYISFMQGLRGCFQVILLVHVLVCEWKRNKIRLDEIDLVRQQSREGNRGVTPITKEEKWKQGQLKWEKRLDWVPGRAKILIKYCQLTCRQNSPPECLFVKGGRESLSANFILNRQWVLDNPTAFWNEIGSH